MNSFRKLINSRINKEELIKKPELNSALLNDKIMRLDLLSPVKPNIIDTKGFKNEKKKTMVEDMNLFKQIYYKDYMINKHSLEKINKIADENTRFLYHFSGFNKYYNNENQKEILNDIQQEYKKKIGFAPTIKENGNLFSNSILLQNERDLKQYISLDLDTIKKDVNSLSFLKNIQNKIKFNGSKSKRSNNLERIGNKEIAFIDEENENNIRKNIKKYYSTRIEKDVKEDINELQRDINKTKECVTSIDTLNNFLNTTNQQNSNLGNLKSRKSSGDASTRINSGVKKINNKLKLMDDLNNYTTNKNNIYNKIDLNKTKDNGNNSKNNNTIVLPYIKSNYSIETEIDNIATNKKNRKTIDYIKIAEPINNENVVKKNLHYKNLKTYSKKKTKKKNKMSLRKEPSLEKLYEKISKTENFIDYNKEIKNYLKKNNYKVNEKINTNNLYKSVDKSRKKIIDVSNIQKNYDLMIDNKLKTLKQNNEVIQYNNKIKKNIENIEERMIGLFCEVNKYEDN